MIPAVMPTYARQDLSFVSGEGAWLTEASGERYLDFGAGIGVNALGHGHPKLVEAVTRQANAVWHLSNLYRIPGQEALAERLVEETFADTVFFTNSGAEAIECCIKAARRHHSQAGRPERWRIIGFEGAFHGRTLATIAAAGQRKLVEGCGPMPDGFSQVPFGDHEALEAAIGPETAAILIEPVQGEGGVRPVPPQCLKGLRDLCDHHGVLLIFDEVQCGMGRTGRLFAHEWAGVEPDLMAVAKGIGGGFPLGACLATEHAASGMTVGSHGSTYGGNPLAMAVGAAVIEEMTAPEFLEGVRRKAGLLRQKLEGLVAAHGEVFEFVRGDGLMLGLKCKPANTEVLAAAREERLLTATAGENILRLLPPLILSDAEIEAGVKALDRAAAAVARAHAAAEPA